MTLHLANRITALATVLVLALLAAMPSARAQIVYTVDSTLDQIDEDVFDGLCVTPAGTCTLRAAVMQANRLFGPSVTIVLPPGVYTLTRPVPGLNDEQSGDLDFFDAGPGAGLMQLQGSSAATTVIDANGIDRVLEIGNRRDVIIDSLTLRGGRNSDKGGGVYVHGGGTLAIRSSALSDNIVDGFGDGGGISNEGSLQVFDSEIRANTAFTGGGIGSLGSLWLSRSTIVQNQASAGAGISSLGTLTVLRSTMADNHGLIGAGVLTQGFAEISKSTLSGNVADANGGGIYAVGNLVLINSTVAVNFAGVNGGGIFARTTSAAKNLYNSTIAFNGADSDQNFDGTGGGIYVDAYQPGSFDLFNTLIAGNTVSASPQPDDCRGVVQTHAQNLFGSISGCTIVQISGSWAFLNALSTLGPLQDNGGATETIALLAGSNAIDAGNPGYGCRDSGSNPITVDQRDRPRNVGICDLGAYEYGAEAPDPDDRIFASSFE